ncbi:MAG: energy transducer TonB [Saprospirales bacterium]|nr:MAG: energy transducer TonB [Saprospirales bacterium]
MEWVFYNAELSILFLFLSLAGLIVLLRLSLWRRSKRYRKWVDHENSPSKLLLISRNKYPGLSVFNRFSTHLALGFIFSLSLVAVLINWTTKEIITNPVIEVIYDIESADIVELRTPPPKPPPPPPPMDNIEIEPDVEVEPIEFTDFEDEESVVQDENEGITEDYRYEDVYKPPSLPTYTASDPDLIEIFDFVEHMPRFPGCEQKGLSSEELQLCSDRQLLEFIARHIRFSALARENRIEGVAVISFVVNRDGRIEDPEIIRDPGGGLGQQALRVVKMMNEMDENWIPGQQAGRKVNVRFNLPVRFTLE